MRFSGHRGLGEPFCRRRGWKSPWPPLPSSLLSQIVPALCSSFEAALIEAGDLKLPIMGAWRLHIFFPFISKGSSLKGMCQLQGLLASTSLLDHAVASSAPINGVRARASLGPWGGVQAMYPLPAGPACLLTWF